MSTSRVRATFVFFLLAIGFGFVAARAIRFQVQSDTRLKRLAENKARLNQQVQTDELLTSRGAILDRTGKDLALSILVKSFFANPKLIKNPQNVAQKLSPLLDIPVVKLRALLKQDKFFVWLKREVDEMTAKKIEALELEGIFSKKESKRVYPSGEVARSVLGISGRDGLGLEGIEKGYDRYLRTTDKISRGGIRDALGRLLLFDDFEREWFETHHVLTTVDLRIQRLVEEELRATVEQKNAISGQAVMLDPKTGEILAMATVEGKRAEKNPTRNRVISDLYEPGSTFKVLLAAAAMEHLQMTANSQIFGENGMFRVGSNIVKEYHGHKYGWISLQELLEVSSNIAAAKTGLKIGAKPLEDTLKKLGFSKPTGIDVPGEASGLMRDAGSWKPIELANISFGQGIAVTPLQMARAVAAVANGGYLVQPHVVSKVIAPKPSASEPEVIWQANPERREVMPAERARALTDMLIHITDEGSTGMAASIEGFQVAGKTGTSQKLVEREVGKGKKIKGYASDHSIVSFVGYVPAYNPAFVLLVLYDDPMGRVSGGNTAAPSFRRIAGRTIAILGIPPQNLAPEAPVPLVAETQNKEASEVSAGGFVGKSFQEVLREVREFAPEQRAKYDLIGFGKAYKEENSGDRKIRVYFK